MAAYLDRVLDLWSLDRDELDHDELFWRRLPDGSWRFLVLCNDLFAPAADAEEIGEDDLNDLERAVADLRALGTGDESWGPILWVARKRKKRLWRLEVRDVPDVVRGLFEAAAD